MKARFPLSTKIFLLAFLNLLLLGAVALVFARVQFHAEFGSFLFSPAEERVLAAARLLALDLEETESTRRDELLQRYGRTYAVQFYLFLEDGTQVGGTPVQLPPRVLDEVRKPPPGQRPGEGRPPRRREDGPPPPRFDGGEGNRPAPPPPQRQEGNGPPRNGNPQHQLFEVTASNLYWVGARIPLRDSDDKQGSPGAVLMTSPSFFGTPLFFDSKPWVAVGGAMAAVFALCWLPLIRGLSRSISQITRVTGQIAEGQFEECLPEARRDELGQLAAAINRMAARLSGFVTGQKRFLGDIAHELCSPIARIQFALGILEQRAEDGQRESVEDLREEVRQMSGLVSELLQFSKAGMRQDERPLVPVSMAEIAREAADREGEGKVDLTVDQGLMAWGEPEYLLRAVLNLVRNALRYAADAGPIAIRAYREGEEAVIVVEDSGPGLPADELERVFTPFYRVEMSRNRALGGVGLGLAIVKGCVESCKGKVQCRNRAPSGLAVEIRLKASS